MRLLTHNSLKCNKKGLSKGYPLQLQVDEMKVTESEYNEEFIKSTLDSLDWEGVLVAANAIGFQGMPAELPVDQINNEEFLRACHKLLLVSGDPHAQLRML